MEKAGNLVQKAEEIQQLVEMKHGLAINKSLAIQIGLKEELQRTQPLEEVSALRLDLSIFGSKIWHNKPGCK